MTKTPKLSLTCKKSKFKLGNHYWRHFFRLEIQDNLKKKAFLDQKLKKFGIDIQRDYSKILSGINLKRLKNNPINVDENDIKKILLSLK